MVKKLKTILPIILIMVIIVIGPFFFKKYWIDYRESYEEKKENIDWKGIITLWDYPKLDTMTGSRYSWMNKKIKEFEKSHPGVYIEYKTLDSINGKATLRAAIKINAIPDIAPIGSDMFFLSSGLLEPLNEYISNSDWKDFLEGATSSCTYKDTIYGIPWAQMGYTLLLNKDMFSDKEVDLPEDGFWTYEEFLECLKKLTFENKRKGDSKTYGLLGYIGPGYYNIFGILMGKGTSIIDESSGKYSFDSPEALEGLTRLYELKNKYDVLHSNIEDLNLSTAFNIFLEGKGAVLLGESWMVPYLRNIGNKYGINFTVAHYPSDNEKYPLYINEKYCSYGVFKQEDNAKKEICIELIKFLTDCESQEKLKDFGYFPVRKSCIHIYQNDKEMYTIQQGLEFAKNISCHKYWWEIDGILQYAILDVLMDKKSPEEAIQDSKTLTNKYFNDKIAE